MGYDADVIVIGGGIMGTATSYALAVRGVKTILLERFRLGHLRGSSGGPTRIFRLAIAEPRYAQMAVPALEAWRSLERVAGQPLLVTTGGLDIGEKTERAAESLESIGAPFEWLTTADARERWPGMRFEDGEEILFHPGAGVCYAERTVLALAGLATERGAEIREETPVAWLDVDADGVQVSTEGGETLKAPVAVVTVGSWAGPMLREVGIDLQLTPTVEQVSYFRLETPSPLPTVIDWSAAVPASEGFQSRGPYAVPDPEHPGDVKLALHMSGPPADPAEGPFEVDPARIEEVAAWAARRFAPLVETHPAHTCLYTRTPDHDFVIDREGPLVIGSPCSGHGFKFGPLIGELLADLATGASPTVDLFGFSASRSGVRGGR
ncbi:MAG: FAD-dependent oxidoreductase [Actinomycetota bacterium]